MVRFKAHIINGEVQSGVLWNDRQMFTLKTASSKTEIKFSRFIHYKEAEAINKVCKELDDGYGIIFDYYNKNTIFGRERITIWAKYPVHLSKEETIARLTAQ